MIQLKPGIPPSALNKPRKAADRRQNRSAKKTKSGLHFERVFSDAAVRPFDQVEWEHRTAEITDDSGQIIFKQEDVEVPKNWRALAPAIIFTIARPEKPSALRLSTNIRKAAPVSSRTWTTRWKTSCVLRQAKRCSLSTVAAPAPILRP